MEAGASTESRALAAKVHGQLALVWWSAAFLTVFAPVVMGVVGLSGSASTVVPLQAYAFLLGGVVSALAAFILPGRIHLEPREDAALIASIPELAERYRAHDPAARELGSLHTTAYLTLLFCYFPAVLGCIYLGLWQPLWVGFALALLALVLLVARFPRKSGWFSRIDAAAAVEQGHRADGER